MMMGKGYDSKGYSKGYGKGYSQPISEYETRTSPLQVLNRVVKHQRRTTLISHWILFVCDSFVADLEQILPQRCSPFPSATDTLVSVDATAPFSPGDRLVVNRPVYTVNKSGECDTSEYPVADVIGACTIVAYPIITCDGLLSAERANPGDYFSVNLRTALGSSDSYEQIISGGAGKYAGLTGLAKIDVYRPDPANDVGIDFITFYASK